MGLMGPFLPCHLAGRGDGVSVRKSGLYEAGRLSKNLRWLLVMCVLTVFSCNVLWMCSMFRLSNVVPLVIFCKMLF